MPQDPDGFVASVGRDAGKGPTPGAAAARKTAPAMEHLPSFKDQARTAVAHSVMAKTLLL